MSEISHSPPKDTLGSEREVSDELPPGEYYATFSHKDMKLNLARSLKLLRGAHAFLAALELAGEDHRGLYDGA